jgi:CBS domain-containing protein
MQPIFPVLVGSTAVGIAHREDLIYHSGNYKNEYVGSVTMKQVPQLSADATVAEALSAMEETGCPVIIVTGAAGFEGVLLQDYLNERVLLSALRESRTNTDDAEWLIQP